MLFTSALQTSHSFESCTAQLWELWIDSDHLALNTAKGCSKICTKRTCCKICEKHWHNLGVYDPWQWQDFGSWKSVTVHINVANTVKQIGIAEGTPGSLMFSRGSYPIVTVFETSKNSSMKQVHYNFEMDYKNVDPHQFSPYAQFFFYWCMLGYYGNGIWVDIWHTPVPYAYHERTVNCAYRRMLYLESRVYMHVQYRPKVSKNVTVTKYWPTLND